MGDKDHRKVVPFSRDYRRAPKFDMGLPPKRPQRKARRAADPVRYLKRVIVLSTAGLFILPTVFDAVIGFTKTTADAAGDVRILRVVDGDTVTVMTTDGTRRARLAGFDTPELFSPQCPAEAAAALQAKWALRVMLLQAGEVKIVRDGEDRYGRLLIRGFVDGRPLAADMISAGHARAYAGGQRQTWCA